MRHLILFLPIALIGFSCTKTVELKTVQTSYKSERILPNELGLITYVVGPYLLIKQDQNVPDGDVFHVYDLKTLEFLGGVGKRGRQAPNSFYGTNYGGQYYESDGNWSIWINDPPRFRVSSLNITKSLKQKESVLDTIINYNPDMDFMRSVFVLDEDKLLATQPGFQRGTNEKPIHILQNGELKSFGEYPNIEGLPENLKKDPSRLRVVNKTALEIKPDGSLILATQRNYDLLEIYNANGSLKYSHRPETFVPYQYSGDPEKMIRIEDLQYSYKGSAVTNEYIFALYLNERYDENKIQSPQLRIFNWKAELLAEIQLEEDLWSISIDEENGYLYAGSIKSEELFRYKLETYKYLSNLR